MQPCQFQASTSAANLSLGLTKVMRHANLYRSIMMMPSSSSAAEPTCTTLTAVGSIDYYGAGVLFIRQRLRHQHATHTCWGMSRCRLAGGKH
jgi:hypothetical protein